MEHDSAGWRFSQERCGRFTRVPSLPVFVALVALASVVVVVPSVQRVSAQSDVWDNAIVKQSQKPNDPTSWLLIEGERYWIPTEAIYNCLRSSGVPGPIGMSNADLDARRDQWGQQASCGQGNNPRGSFDELWSDTPGRIRVRGWSADPNVIKRSIAVHVYVGGPAGSGAEGFNLGRQIAYRPDINNAFPGYGNYHGFDAAMVTNRRGWQSVCAYAINAGPGGNVLLGCRSVYIASPDPFGAFDSVSSDQQGKIRVQGWAADPSNPAIQIQIHAYVGGLAGSGAEGINLYAAGSYRPDVGKVYPGYGDYHGFDRIVSTSRQGRQTVCVYAINILIGQNTLLGCRTVDIAGPSGSFMQPFPGAYSSQDYACRGCMGDGLYHTGVDLVSGANPVVAPGDGVVVAKQMGQWCPPTGSPECGSGYGNYVRIRFTLENGRQLYGTFGHLADNNAVPPIGSCIHKGSALGPAGRSGRVTGVHLHFELQTVDKSGPGYSASHPDSSGFVDPNWLLTQRFRSC